MDFDLTPLTTSGSLSEGWTDWRAEPVPSNTDTGANTGVVGEYAGDGTIDPSVLGGGEGGSGTSPDKFGDSAIAPVHRARPSRGAMDGFDDEEEEDVMGLLFERASDDDFVPPSPSKGKDRAGESVEGVESVGVAAAAGRRIRTKSWRQVLAEEAETDYGGESEDGNPLAAQAVSAPVLRDADHRAKRTRTTSSSGMLVDELTFCHHCRRKTRRPKMCCTLVKEKTDEPCRKLFCDLCIEKRCAAPILFYSCIQN